MKSKKIALYGVLICLCLILSYVEVIIPFNFIFPGIKLGLSNIVVMYAIYCIDIKAGFYINFIRIALVSILFTSPSTIIYSIAGGLLSLLAMIIVIRFKSLSIISVSVTGGIFHNIGQIIAASFVLGSSKVIFYLPVLMVAGILTGILTGVIGAISLERIKKV